MPDKTVPWPHAPAHRLASDGTYFVTASTYQKLHHFSGPERLGILQRGLLKLAEEFGWQLEAWAVFSNHTISSGILRSASKLQKACRSC